MAVAPITLAPIGTVANACSTAVDSGWGDVESEIRLIPDYVGGLVGLEQFSHALVLTFLHEATFDRERQLVRRPRDRDDLEPLGVFAQRSRHRPNPIGVSVVPILRVEAGVLVVRGLDAINGTPVLDIKPHVPLFDAPADPRVPAWVADLFSGYW